MNDLSPMAVDGLVELADLAVGFDRSWSFAARGLDRRALFFLPASAEAQDALLHTAGLLGFDAAGLDAFRDALPGADAIGMTLSQGGSVRLYLQYWQQMGARVVAGDLSPGPLYLGIKRWPGGGGRSDSYVCTPLAPAGDWSPVLTGALQNFGCDPAAVTRFLAPLTAENGIWTRVENTERRSWLMSMHRAEPDPKALIAALAPVATREGVREVIAALVAGAPLHLAGGIDANKAEFFSMYVECDRAEMLRFIVRLSAPGG